MTKADVLKQNEYQKTEFLQWAKIKNVDIQTTSDLTAFKVGQKVTYTNSFGCIFPHHEVLGYSNDLFYGRFIYINTDCYWMTVSPESLILE